MPPLQVLKRKRSTKAGGQVATVPSPLSPPDDDKPYIKRIIGLPGERVRIRQGQVYIDDEPLREDYVKNRAPWNESELELGPDEYFLVGDNRGMASRDHDHGAVRRSKIVGKVLL